MSQIVSDGSHAVKGKTHAPSHGSAGRWVKRALDDELQALTCFQLREMVRRLRRADSGVQWLAIHRLGAVAVEATDRAINGCPCGSLIERRPGECRWEEGA